MTREGGASTEPHSLGRLDSAGSKPSGLISQIELSSQGMQPRSAVSGTLEALPWILSHTGSHGLPRCKIHLLPSSCHPSDFQELLWLFQSFLYKLYTQTGCGGSPGTSALARLRQEGCF